jgi:hypothetical protein
LPQTCNHLQPMFQRQLVARWVAEFLQPIREPLGCKIKFRASRRKSLQDKEINQCERQELNLHGFPHWILRPATELPNVERLKGFGRPQEGEVPSVVPSSFLDFAPIIVRHLGGDSGGTSRTIGPRFQDVISRLPGLCEKGDLHLFCQSLSPHQATRLVALAPTGKTHSTDCRRTQRGTACRLTLWAM